MDRHVLCLSSFIVNGFPLFTPRPARLPCCPPPRIVIPPRSAVLSAQLSGRRRCSSQILSNHDLLTSFSLLLFYLSFSFLSLLASFLVDEFFLHPMMENKNVRVMLSEDAGDVRFFRGNRFPNIRTKVVHYSFDCCGYSGCYFRPNLFVRQEFELLLPDWRPTCSLSPFQRGRRACDALY